MINKTKFAEKLRVYKAIHDLTYEQMVETWGVCRTGLCAWSKGRAIPKRIQSREVAQRIVDNTNGYFNLKELGW